MSTNTSKNGGNKNGGNKNGGNNVAATPAATPDATPAATPAATPDATPAATPAATPDATPAATPAATLSDILNASGESFELASGKVTRKSVASAESVADRATLYSNKVTQAAIATTTENIAIASGNRTRSIIATTRGLCGLVVRKNETPQNAAQRLLFGNGRTHFSSFLKLPKLSIKMIPVEYAAANCVNADGAIESHAGAETVPVLFATR